MRSYSLRLPGKYAFENGQDDNLDIPQIILYPLFVPASRLV